MIKLIHGIQTDVKPKNCCLDDSIGYQRMKVRVAEKNLTKVQMKKRKFLQKKTKINNYLTTIQNLSSEISCQAENFVIRQISALKIQKFYRGYLVRKTYEEVILK